MAKPGPDRDGGRGNHRVRNKGSGSISRSSYQKFGALPHPGRQTISSPESHRTTRAAQARPHFHIPGPSPTGGHQAGIIGMANLSSIPGDITKSRAATRLGVRPIEAQEAITEAVERRWRPAGGRKNWPSSHTPGLDEDTKAWPRPPPSSEDQEKRRRWARADRRCRRT